jgi:HEAT repeat protein
MFRRILQGVLAGALLLGASCDNNRGGSPQNTEGPRANVGEAEAVQKTSGDATPSVIAGHPDVWFLHEAGVGTETAQLIAFLEKHSVPDEDLLQLNRWLTQLGSPRYRERDEASRKLVNLGAAALPGLRSAERSADGEIARRAATCIQKITAHLDSSLPLSVLRVLVHRRSEGATKALLHYLPFAPDEATLEEVAYGLNALAGDGARIDPCLLQALRDGSAPRRAIAACLVGRLGTSEQRATVRKLLADADPLVRLRAAQGLLAGKDKEAIPALIALLQDRSIEICWQAEELLHWAAGDSAPTTTAGGSPPESRLPCYLAWAEWWRQRGSQVDLDHWEDLPRRPGLVLIGDGAPVVLRPDPPPITDVHVQIPPEVPPSKRGRVWVCGWDGKPRWQMQGLNTPASVQWLPGGRILLLEQQPYRNQAAVTERDLQAKVWWEKKVNTINNHVIACRRLRNGNTFIGMRETIMEVTAAGVELYSRKKGTFDSIQRLSNGLILGIGKFGLDLELLAYDPIRDQYPWKRTLDESLRTWGAIEELGPDRFLVPSTNLLELSGSGKIIRQWKGISTRSTRRLPNGNTLLTNTVTGAGLVFEMESSGRIVWQVVQESIPLYADVCLGLVRLGFDQRRPASADAYYLPSLVRGLRAPALPMRRVAATRLGQLGARAEPALPALLEAIEDPDDHVSWGAEQAITAIGTPAVPGLVAKLKSKNQQIRIRVLRCLFDLKERAKEAVPALIEAFQDKDEAISHRAASALGSIGPSADAAVPVLLEALTNKKKPHDVRCSAAAALGCMGPRGKAAIPALLKTLKEPESVDLQRGAMFALAGLNTPSPEVLHELIRILKEMKSEGLCAFAALALGQMGPQAKSAVPALIEIVDTPVTAKPAATTWVKGNVVNVLGMFGPNAKGAVPSLMKVLEKEEEEYLRRAAIVALGKIGPAAKAVLPLLAKVAESDEWGRYRAEIKEARRMIERH